MTRGGGSLGCKGLSCDKPRGFCPFSPGCLVKGLKLCKILPGHFSQQCIQGKINSCFVLFLLSLEDQAMTDSLQCTSSPQLPSQPVDRPSPGTVCSALSVCLSVCLSLCQLFPLLPSPFLDFPKHPSTLLLPLLRPCPPIPLLPPLSQTH